MELPKIKKSEHGMLEGIKSKLGFADANRQYDDGYYDEGFDEYGKEYGEYGPDYNEADFPAEDAPSARYDPYAPVTTRPAGAAHARSSARGSSFTPPKLVSIDDVRAHTQVPESLNRDPLPPRRVTSSAGGSYRGDRTMIDAAQPAPANTPIARANAAANRERSESLNALFTSTSDDAPLAVPTASGSAARAGGNASASAAAAATAPFDPFDAYAGSGAAKHNPSRSVTVLKPASYGEVERIAKALKAGDVVVLALRNTSDNLSKRILDFSFGVSSALDASVDCVADKVFVISRGMALTDAERIALRGQGVL